MATGTIMTTIMIMMSTIISTMTMAMITGMGITTTPRPTWDAPSPSA